MKVGAIRCDRCGISPAKCPCLLFDGWQRRALPRTTIPGVGVVEVVALPGTVGEPEIQVAEYGWELRVRVRLHAVVEAELLLPEVGTFRADPLIDAWKPLRQQAVEVAKAWQDAIEERAGTSRDWYFSTLDDLRDDQWTKGMKIQEGLRDPKDRRSYGLEQQARYQNDGFRKLGEACLQARPGREMNLRHEALIRDLDAWFKGDKPKRICDEIIARLNAGPESIPDSKSWEVWPLNKDALERRYKKARERVEAVAEYQRRQSAAMDEAARSMLPRRRP